MGMFAWNRRSGLLALDGDPAADKGGVTGRVMKAAYEAFLPEYMDPSGHGEFQHDGAGPHRSFLVRDCLIEMGIRVMIWPPYSPDLTQLRISGLL